MILLLSQQSLAAFMPMNCDDMQEASVVSQESDLHISSQMHQQNSSSKDKMSSHENCNVCDSGGCRCCTMGPCLGSTHTITSQSLNEQYVLFVALGKRFLSTDESPDSGIALHPYRPPILS